MSAAESATVAIDEDEDEAPVSTEAVLAASSVDALVLAALASSVVTSVAAPTAADDGSTLTGEAISKARPPSGD